MNQKVIEMVKEMERRRIKEYIWWSRTKGIGRHKHLDQIDTDYTHVYCVIKKYYPEEFREGLDNGRKILKELSDEERAVFRYHSDFLFPIK